MSKRFYLIDWQHPNNPRYYGSDLVFAADKREARGIYSLKHYSKVVAIRSEPEERRRAKQEGWKWKESDFANISQAEYEKARQGEVVTIVEGT